MKRAENPRERRREPRRLLHSPLKYRILQLPPPARMIRMVDTVRRAGTRDISSRGAGVTVTQLLLPGTLLAVTVPKSAGGRSGVRHAKVMWVREIRPGTFRAGLKFQP